MPESLARNPSDKPRVLVVDDEKFIRDILADFLSLEGYAVRTAQDGSAAITELHNAPYDLVITDLKMPKLGGLRSPEGDLNLLPRNTDSDHDGVWHC